MNICWWYAYTHSQHVRTYTQRNTQLTYRPMVIWGKAKSISPNGENGVTRHTHTCISTYIYTLLHIHPMAHTHMRLDHNASKCVRCHIKYIRWFTIFDCFIMYDCLFFTPPEMNIHGKLVLCICGIFAVSNISFRFLFFLRICVNIFSFSFHSIVALK